MQDATGVLLIIGLMLLIIAGWITHIVTTLAAKAWLFMIVGALIPPVAVFHGWSNWLGYNWLA